MQAATEGKPFKTVTISFSGNTLTLSDVVITSFSVLEGSVVDMELNAAKREFK